MTDKAAQDMRNLMKQYGLVGEDSAATTYTASVPKTALRLLNMREKASLDVQYAHLKVA